MGNVGDGVVLRIGRATASESGLGIGSGRGRGSEGGGDVGQHSG